MKFLTTVLFFLITPVLMISQTYSVTSTPSGANEVPPNASTGTATLNGTYDANTNQLTLNVTYANLDGTLTASHLHKAAAGSNGGVIVNLNPSTGSSSGTIAGTFPIDPGDVGDLFAGDVYINLHSTVFPGGELRGQLSLMSAAPKSEVDIESGDITVLDNLYGVILKSPSGDCYRVQVDNDGNLVTSRLNCPDEVIE